jgi:hypothetical protein
MRCNANYRAALAFWPPELACPIMFIAGVGNQSNGRGGPDCSRKLDDQRINLVSHRILCAVVPTELPMRALGTRERLMANNAFERTEMRDSRIALAPPAGQLNR